MTHQLERQRFAHLLTAGVTSLALIVVGGQAWAQQTQEVRYETEGAQRAEIELLLGLGELLVSALEEGEVLIEGTVETAEDEELQREFRVADEVAELRLESERNFSLFNNFGNERVWDFALSPSMPLDLTVEVGAGRTELDLTGLTLSELQVNAGVGESIITLPAEGRFDAHITGGIGATTVRIPENLAARIRSSTGLGTSNIHGDFEQQDDVFVSPDYNTAQDRVDLELEAGVGEVTVETVE